MAVTRSQIHAEFAALNGTCTSWWDIYADAIEVAAQGCTDPNEMIYLDMLADRLEQMTEAGWFGKVH